MTREEAGAGRGLGRAGVRAEGGPGTKNVTGGGSLGQGSGTKKCDGRRGLWPGAVRQSTVKDGAVCSGWTDRPGPDISASVMGTAVTVLFS